MAELRPSGHESKKMCSSVYLVSIFSVPRGALTEI
jgi:hypothetical protein